MPDFVQAIPWRQHNGNKFIPVYVTEFMVGHKSWVSLHQPATSKDTLAKKMRGSINQSLAVKGVKPQLETQTG